mgnify:CR=1 FL=1
MISIDFWNTIVIAHTNGELRNEARVNGLREIAQKYGEAPSLDAIKKAHQAASIKFDEIWLGSQRTPTSRELVDISLDYLKLNFSEEDRKKVTLIYQESLLDGPPELTPGVGDALEALASKDKLAIISDTMFSPGTVLRGYLKSKGLLNFFTAFAFSDEVGVSKPHQKMYEKVLAETDGNPETSWHIGDIHQTDIKGAQAMGMKAVLYTGINKNDAETSTADLILDSWDEIQQEI